MNRKGFTLVEILVAIALIGIIAVTFLPLLTFSYTHLLDAKRYTTDLNLIQKQVEQQMEIARNNDAVTGAPDVSTISVFGKSVNAHVIKQPIKSAATPAHGEINALVPKNNIVYNEPAIDTISLSAYVNNTLVSNPQFLFPVTGSISFRGSDAVVISHASDYLLSVYRWYMSPVMDIGDTTPPTDIREWIILKEWNEARTPLSYGDSNGLTFIPNIESNFSRIDLSEFAFLDPSHSDTLIAEKFAGRYFVYSVTPYSIIGRVGVEVFSNPISTNRISSIRDTVDNEIRVSVEWIRPTTYTIANFYPTVQANMIDGTVRAMNVTWDSASIPITSATQPDVTVNGRILGYPDGVKLILHVVDAIDNNPGTTSIAGPTQLVIPRTGSTTAAYTAEVYNLAGVLLPSEPVTWSLTTGAGTGISINTTTGVVTVASNATPRTLTVLATTTNPAVFANLQASVVSVGQVADANSLASTTNLTNPRRCQFSATIKDSNGITITGLTAVDFRINQITSGTSTFETLPRSMPIGIILFLTSRIKVTAIISGPSSTRPRAGAIQRRSRATMWLFRPEIRALVQVI